MKMDIATPAELMAFEQADFGDGRRQAYLTFLNEASFAITALSCRIFLLDEEGKAVEDRRESFGDLSVLPGARFTCHLALDGYPDFADAAVIVEDVLFDGEEPWALHPLRLKDYDPPLLPDGPERAALIAIAGEDAVCFPAQQDSMWICVCGRFNRWRWTTCRRCQRERGHVLEHFTPERVMETHRQRVQAAASLPPRVIVDGTEAGKRARAAAQQPAAPTKAKQKKQRPAKERPTRQPPGRATPNPDLIHRIVIILSCLVVAALLLWGVISLAGRLSQGSAPDSGTTVYHAPDYLDPL